VIDHQLALSGSPFQTALDDELTADFPICTLLRVEANANPSSALASVTTDTGMARQNGSGSQRFGSTRSPLRILRRAEYVIRFTLCSFVLRVLFNRRHLGDQLKLEMRITQGLAESG
jgi:hypothetical protein